MEGIDVGFWSIVPPLIAIVLALVTKEVISSLLIGILSGTFIYAVYTSVIGINGEPAGILDGIVRTFSKTSELMSNKMAANASIIIFLALLGALVAVVTRAGGSRAYGEWASRKLKRRSSALLATSVLGIIIFIDDYFNCLTVGTVMRPVTDKYRVSRAKLAYIIDATAAPVCIIAPVSSWAASVISQMEGTGLKGMDAFLGSIPFNLYALLTIGMVIFIALSNRDYGPMRKIEKTAVDTGDLHSRDTTDVVDDELAKSPVSDKGLVMDLLVPILALILFSVLAMIYIGGGFDGATSVGDAFGNTDAGAALALGGLGALIVTFIFFMIRRVISFNEFMQSIGTGVKSMVPAFIILVLAWSISGVCRDMLNTGQYVGHLVETSNMPVGLIPAIIFAVAAALSFSTGTSWGTFGILIPIISTVCLSVAPNLMIVSLAATLAGSVFGDHCSPISDTTILSSTGAGCHHIDHVRTQLPYALTVAVCCFLGYIVAGFTNNAIITLVVSSVLLVLALFLLPRLSDRKTARKA